MVRHHWRAAWGYPVLLVMLIAASLVLLCFPLLVPRTRGGLQRWWCRTVLHCLGIQLEISTELDRRLPPCLIVANHVSFVDIVAIRALFDAAFVAKSEIARWPLIGWLARKSGNHFLVRGSARAAQEMRETLVRDLAEGKTLVVFPEGMTSRGDRVLPFHSALLQSAIDAACTVACLTLSYHDEQGRPTSDPAFVDGDHLLSTLSRIFRHRRLVVRIGIAGLLLASEYDRRHLAHRCHQIIARQLERQRHSLQPLKASA